MYLLEERAISTAEALPVRPSDIAKAIIPFVLGFAIISIAIHFCIQRPLRLYAAIRSEKIRLLDEWGSHALSASFGSSHVHNGFDPRAFDNELKGTALQTVSLNLGIEGGSQSEQRAMALEFLHHLRKPAAKPASCFVLLELSAGANFTVDHLLHPRSINIYDFDTTRFVLHLSDPTVEYRRGLGRAAFALSAAGLHAANIGMLSSSIFSPRLNDAMIAAQTQNDRRGLYNEEEVSARDRLSLAEAFDNSSRVPRPEMQRLLPGNYDLLWRLSEESPISNVQFIYFISPKLADRIRFPEYPATIDGPNGTVPIINLARPDRYPLLYQQQYWHDNSHLNESGAGVASRILAAELKSWYAKEPRVPVCGG
jgi:hypothetical protein